VVPPVDILLQSLVVVGSRIVDVESVKPAETVAFLDMLHAVVALAKSYFANAVAALVDIAAVGVAAAVVVEIVGIRVVVVARVHSIRFPQFVESQLASADVHCCRSERFPIDSQIVVVEEAGLAYIAHGGVEKVPLLSFRV
jgi:hypothetical protein